MRYDPRKVFNADEVGRFYEATGRRSLIFIGDDGGKKFEKITILIKMELDGHLEPLVVINKPSETKEKIEKNGRVFGLVFFKKSKFYSKILKHFSFFLLEV